MVRHTDKLTDLFEVQRNSLELNGYFEASLLGKERLGRCIDKLWWLAQKHSNDYRFRDSKYDVALLLVLPGECIPAEYQIAMAKVDAVCGALDPHVLQHLLLLRNTGGIITSPEPYLVLQVVGGEKTLRIAPARAVQQFHKEKRTPLNIYEGIALVTHYPEILLNHNIALPGSCFGTRGMPIIELIKGVATLTCRPFTAEDIRRGSASCFMRVTDGA